MNLKLITMIIKLNRGVESYTSNMIELKVTNKTKY